MAFDRSELRAAVKVAIGSRGDISDTTINSYLDLSQERIARIPDANWVELEQQTDLTIPYTGVPATDKTWDVSSLTNLHRFIKIVVEDGTESQPMAQVEVREFDRIHPQPEEDAENRPVEYTLWTADAAILWPPPDKAYTARIRWIKWPASLSTDSQESDLLYKDDLLVFLTSSFLFSLLREEDQAARLFNIYESELKRALADNRSKPDNEYQPAFLRARNQYTVSGPYWRDPFFRGF